jgi:hypothetical protein
MRDSLKNRNIYLVGIVFILIILMLIIKFPYNIKVPCQIVGQKEWALIQVEPDKILNKTFDNKEDKTVSFTLLQFAREDFVKFKQYPTDENWIDKDDPIANIVSLDNQISMANLAGELEKAHDNLSIASVGEKQALLEEAERSLELANIQFSAYEPQYLRNKELYENNLISSSEWEITRAMYDGYQSNIALQEARLEVVRTGEKNEIVRYMKDHVEQLKSQVQLMDKKMAMGDLRAPFSGLISYPSQDSIICLIENVDSLLCKLPVTAPDRKYLESGQEITIRLFENNEAQQAEIINIGHRSKFINGIPSYIITGYINSVSDEILPGMSGIAEIQCAKITLIEHIFRSFNKYMMQI